MSRAQLRLHCGYFGECRFVVAVRTHACRLSACSFERRELHTVVCLCVLPNCFYSCVRGLFLFSWLLLFGVSVCAAHYFSSVSKRLKKMHKRLNEKNLFSDLVQPFVIKKFCLLPVASLHVLIHSLPSAKCSQADYSFVHAGIPLLNLVRYDYMVAECAKCPPPTYTACALSFLAYLLTKHFVLKQLALASISKALLLEVSLMFSFSRGSLLTQNRTNHQLLHPSSRTFIPSHFCLSSVISLSGL